MFWLSQFLSLLTAVYVLLFVAAAGAALWLPKSHVVKAVGFVAVCALFGLPLLEGYAEDQERMAHNKMIAERFEKLCREKAGEKIYQVVENVDGFLILRPRKPTHHLQEYHDQYWMGDPYGHSDMEADSPEHVFLADRRGYESGTTKIRPIAGYDYVEIQLAENDSKERYRRIEIVKRHDDQPGNRMTTTSSDWPEAKSRYGYDWTDISTEEDRKYWIAGGQMRVIDLATQAVIAERVGYLIDVAQGAQSGGRMPWFLAQRSACPPFEDDLSKAQEFVSRVLRPRRELKRD